MLTHAARDRFRDHEGRLWVRTRTGWRRWRGEAVEEVQASPPSNRLPAPHPAQDAPGAAEEGL